MVKAGREGLRVKEGKREGGVLCVCHVGHFLKAEILEFLSAAL